MLKCLASPACNDVVRALRSLGQGTASEVGAAINHSAATAHYHLKQLLKCGLVKEAGKRPSARKPVVVFEIAAKRLKLPRVIPGSVESEYARRAVMAGLREVMRGYEKAAKSITPDYCPMQILRAEIRLSEQDERIFLELLESASRFANANRIEEGRVLNWSSVVYPNVD